VGIADGDLPDHLETLGTSFDLERPWDQLQGGRRAQPMTQLKPEKAEAKKQGNDQQQGEKQWQAEWQAVRKEWIWRSVDAAAALGSAPWHRQGDWHAQNLGSGYQCPAA
jgi:hypothetical protein